MTRTGILQETRKMRFEEVWSGWQEGRLTQEGAAEILGVSDRTFRRYARRYEERGLEGLADRRLGQASHRRAPVDEVFRLTEQYRERYAGYSSRHFYSCYRRKEGGVRSYSWVKGALQGAGLVLKGKKRGRHRKERARAAYVGMMLHQDGSDHEWVVGQRWDLIVTMDDATSEHYSMFFVEEEGTASSFRGVGEVLAKRGLFASIYTDRGSHYWFTPEAGGKVDKTQLTQFGRAMVQLGVEMIPAYSPEARGRSERMFRTHQDRLVKELASHGIETMASANRYLEEVYMPAFNEEFMVVPTEPGSLFVPLMGVDPQEILCEHFERTVGNDNCVHFERMKLQIPETTYRCHYVRVRVQVHRYPDNTLSIFHGPRCLARYDAQGRLQEPPEESITLQEGNKKKPGRQPPVTPTGSRPRETGQLIC